MKNRISGVIFDVDGTLLDSIAMWKNVGAEFLRSKGKEAEEGLDETLFTLELIEGAAYLKETYGLEETPQQVLDGMLAIVRGFYEKKVPLRDGVREVLEEFAARRIPMAAASSGDRECIELAFARLGLNDYISKIFTCKEVGTAKTSPLIYEKAREYLGTRREETYVFEDAVHALKTVKKAGFVAVGVYEESNAVWREEAQNVADIYLENIRDFLKVLE